MARLTTTDKQILEALLQMGGGYVLNFSDRSFGEFFRDDVGVDIFDPKFHYASGSKANRLRGFWQVADEARIASSVLQLIHYIDTQITIGRLKRVDFPKDLIERARAVAVRLDPKLVGKNSGGAAHEASERERSNGSVAPDAQLLTELRDELMGLQPLTPQKRGFAFEAFLSRLFHAFQLAPRNSFRMMGEQIDGSFQIKQDVYLVEAKWENHNTGQSDLLVFSGKVEGKAQWSRGLFVSYSGFTKEGLEAFARGRSTRIICMDGFDLYCILQHALDLGDVINRKMRRAGETNDAFVSVRELYPTKSF